MSGIPPLGGFFVKLDTFAALLSSGNTFTAYALFFRTVASFVYYLRIVKILLFDNGAVASESGNNPIPAKLARSEGRI